VKSFKVLIIDDEKIYRDEIREFLESREYQIFEADKPSLGLNILQKEEIDIVILDFNLPEMDGIEALKKIKNSYPDIEVIMITGFGNMRTVINALRLGAADFFPKPFKLINIQTSIERTKRYLEMKKQLHRTQENFELLSEELQAKTGSQLIGESAAVKSIINLMSKIAVSDKTNVLITGESGTGKELVARGIHYLSKRKHKYFYDVNCGAIPPNLLESELFGYERGAFTGAVKSRKGKFEQASNATLFLDEICELPLDLQVKLLRVIQEKRVSRVGGSEEIPVDVRIMCATNKNQVDEVKAGTFREDLYYRLNVVPVKIPSLMERKPDIPLLCAHFLHVFTEKYNKYFYEISPKALRRLCSYSWPGNVRELENMVERAVALQDSNIILPESYDNIRESSVTGIENSFFTCLFPNTGTSLPDLIEKMEKTYLVEALTRCHGKKIEAAHLLGMSFRSFRYKLEKYGLASQGSAVKKSI